MHKKSNLFVLGGLFGSTVVAGMALAGSGASAARQADATATVTVASTCSMTATIAQGEEHTATLINGIYSGSYETGGSHPYQNGIGKTTIQTFCNSLEGYSIYAIGYTNDTLGNNKMVGAGLSSTYDIITGTATSGTTGNDISNWAMKVSAVSGSYAPTIANGFDSFSAVPDQYTKVAYLDRVTDSAAGANIGSTIETTYAAYISNTQPAGTYTGQVKYALVHPGSVAPTEVLEMQNVANWKADATQWLPGEQRIVRDNRDGRSYTVTRVDLDDDNYEIWMTQNLDLLIGGTYNNNPIVLNSNNTDLNQYDTNGDGTGTRFTGYTVSDGVITWTPTDATLTGTPATFSSFPYGSTDGVVSGWSNTNTGPRMAEGGTTILYSDTNSDVRGIKYDNLAACQAANHTTAECEHYYVGNYYNWTASVAMTNSGQLSSDNYTVAPNSICPKGWRLPNGPVSETTISDFNTIFKALGITSGEDHGLTSESSATNTGFLNGNASFSKLNASPLFFTRAGNVSSTTLNNFGTNGLYWSSTVRDGSNTYSLYYNTSGGLYPAYRRYRDNGRSVRCMAR